MTITVLPETARVRKWFIYKKCIIFIKIDFISWKKMIKKYFNYSGSQFNGSWLKDLKTFY